MITNKDKRTIVEMAAKYHTKRGVSGKGTDV